MEYTFTLTYHLPQADCDLDALVERLGEAGCDDALVGLGLAGQATAQKPSITEFAPRVIRLSHMPWATDASVFIEQGAITMPSDWNDPLATQAPMSRTLCTRSASASMSRRLMSSS